MRNSLFDGKEETQQPPSSLSDHAARPPKPRQSSRLNFRHIIPILAAAAWFISWPLRAGITRMFDLVLLATDTASSLYLSTLSVGLLALVIVYIYRLYQ